MKIASIYNTCGINQDRTDWYSYCLESIFNQSIITDVIVSSCSNKYECIETLKSRFGNLLKIVYFPDKLIVNITFNKTCQLIKKENYDGYLFVDSGVHFMDKNSIEEMTYRLDKYSMITVQTDNDTGFETIGLMQNSPVPQIVDNDFVFPIGKACNLHCQIFSKDILNKFGRIIPDVFAAFCTESTFPFLNASVGKEWVIIKDHMVLHNKSVDGPSSSQPHFSPTHKNPWNNLLYGRDALEFINDKDAYKAGLGYEECANIMNHNTNVYDGNFVEDPNNLAYYVSKYFFSNNKELDYDSINYQIF